MFSLMSVAPVIAHQGGWDEVLLVGGPIVVIIVLLAIAKRRVDAQIGPGSRSDSRPDADTLSE